MHDIMVGLVGKGSSPGFDLVRGHHLFFDLVRGHHSY